MRILYSTEAEVNTSAVPILRDNLILPHKWDRGTEANDLSLTESSLDGLTSCLYDILFHTR